jgi:hypothetical protein
MSTKFLIKQQNIEQVVQFLWDSLYKEEVPCDIWKSTHDIVTNIHNTIKKDFDTWKKAENYTKTTKTLCQSIEKILNKFVKQIEKQGMKGSQWLGADRSCQDLVSEYQHGMKLFMIELIGLLESENPTRKQTEIALNKF